MQKLDAKAIFAVSVDEIGLYELLKQKANPGVVRIG